jgi:hypothetical protein
MYVYTYTYMTSRIPAPSEKPLLFPSALFLSLDLQKLLALFCTLPALLKDLKRLPGSKRPFYERLFSPWVTLWAMVLQRLLADHSLQHTLTHLRFGLADRLFSKGKTPFSEQVTSLSTPSLSDGRQRLPLSFLKEILFRLPSLLLKKSKGLDYRGLPVLLLDGSTLRLKPHGDIPDHYPSHSSKRNSGYFCLVRVVVGFCLRSGLCGLPALGSKYTSEQSLAAHLMLSLKEKALVIGDRNFGVFQVAQAARKAGCPLLVRLTAARAKKLLGKGRELTPGLDTPVKLAVARRCRVQEHCSLEPVEGRLIVRRLKRPGHRPFDLLLFTTLLDPVLYTVEELVELYGFRWHAELNLRHLKSQMDLGFLDTRSAAMAEKEFHAGLIAYNLVRSMMALSAFSHGLEPLCLSFSACRSQVTLLLCDWGKGKALKPALLLAALAKLCLPKRKKARPNEPRKIRKLASKYEVLKGSRQSAREACAGNGQVKS